VARSSIDAPGVESSEWGSRIGGGSREEITLVVKRKQVEEKLAELSRLDDDPQTNGMNS